MSIAIRKWWAVFEISVQSNLAYRATGIIWVLTDVLPAMVMPMVWLHAFNGKAAISGFSPSQMVLYYLVVVTLTNFITSHIMWDLAYEIKEGNFTVYLIRPFSVFQYHMATNLSWRIFRITLFSPFLLLLVIYFRPYLHDVHMYFGWQVWVTILLGHTLSFMIVFAMAMIALWVQEVYSIFGIYYFPMLFLSGQLAPIGVLPKWAQTMGYILPFRYTTAVPAELIVGRLSPNAALPQIGMQVLWIVIAAFAGWQLWGRGIKRYSGVGM